MNMSFLGGCDRFWSKYVDPGGTESIVMTENIIITSILSVNNNGGLVVFAHETGNINNVYWSVDSEDGKTKDYIFGIDAGLVVQKGQTLNISKGSVHGWIL